MIEQHETIEKYSLQATLRSYEKIIEAVEDRFGKGAANKHPAIVSTLLRFQEEMIRSTTQTVVSGAMTLEDLKNLTTK